MFIKITKTHYVCSILYALIVSSSIRVPYKAVFVLSLGLWRHPLKRIKKVKSEIRLRHKAPVYVFGQVLSGRRVEMMVQDALNCSFGVDTLLAIGRRLGYPV